MFDTLIFPKWLIPLNSHDTVLLDYGLAIKDDKIVAIAPKKDFLQLQHHATILELPAHALMPGLINAHAHTPMVLLRSLGDDLPLDQWLTQNIWPAEQNLVNESFVQDGMILGMTEMLRNGITCFSEHYFLPEVAAKTAQNFGMRALIGLWLGDITTSFAQDKSFWFAETHRILKQQHTNNKQPLVDFCFAPHSTYLLDNQGLQQLAEAYGKYNKKIHIHLNESSADVVQHHQDFGMSPIQRLNQYGLVNSDLIAVHMIHTDTDDYEILANNMPSIVTCPNANLKLGSGLCNIQKYRKLGLNVAIGTDGAASNNGLDLFNEAKLASLIAKGLTQDPTLFPALETLKMATIHGAKALGIEAQTGTLEVGKQADVIAINLDNLNTYPQHHPISQIVYALNSRQVQEVWIAGKHMLANGEPTTVDTDELKELAMSWQAKTQNFC